MPPSKKATTSDLPSPEQPKSEIPQAFPTAPSTQPSAAELLQQKQAKQLAFRNQDRPFRRRHVLSIYNDAVAKGHVSAAHANDFVSTVDATELSILGASNQALHDISLSGYQGSISIFHPNAHPCHSQSILDLLKFSLFNDNSIYLTDSSISFLLTHLAFGTRIINDDLTCMALLARKSLTLNFYAKAGDRYTAKE